MEMSVSVSVSALVSKVLIAWMCGGGMYGKSHLISTTRSKPTQCAWDDAEKKFSITIFIALHLGVHIMVYSLLRDSWWVCFLVRSFLFPTCLFLPQKDFFFPPTPHLQHPSTSCRGVVGRLHQNRDHSYIAVCTRRDTYYCFQVSVASAADDGITNTGRLVGWLIG